jgi:hypothetical protein
MWWVSNLSVARISSSAMRDAPASLINQHLHNEDLIAQDLRLGFRHLAALGRKQAKNTSTLAASPASS